MSVFNPFNRLLRWYFSKNSLPYWCLLLLDTLIVIVSAFLTFWIFNKTQITFDHRFEVVYTAFAFGLISWVGSVPIQALYAIPVLSICCMWLLLILYLWY